jgi:hypothetical protein
MNFVLDALYMYIISEIYPNRYIWFENMPSGNPGPDEFVKKIAQNGVHLVKKIYFSFLNLPLVHAARASIPFL